MPRCATNELPPPMRLIFAGTPEFARLALARLHAAGHEIALVLTQPDRPGGRGLKLQAAPVKQFALAHGLPLAQPRSLRSNGNYPEDAAGARRQIEAAQAEAMVVAAYGLILPQWLLDALAPTLPEAPAVSGIGAKKWGCFNIHASLLPRWRGAAPIQRAIEAGDAETGITIMQMDAGLDTGAMLLRQPCPIAAGSGSGVLHDQLAALGAELIVQALALAQQGRLQPQPQPTEGICYAHKISKAEARIDWRASAATIERRIRAFDPQPGAYGLLAGETIKLFCSEIDSESRSSDADFGTILSANQAGLRVQCGSGVLCLTELQRAGGRRLRAADFLRGFGLAAGARFEPLPAALAPSADSGT